MSTNYGPRRRQSRKPAGQQREILQTPVQPSFNEVAFRNAINSHGIRVVHFRAIPDPSAMTSKGDNRAVDGIRMSSDGFIYEEAGTLQALFVSNSDEERILPEGIIEYSSAYMTLPEFYEDKPKVPVLVMPWDRFFLKDIEIRVAGRQTVEASSSGIDRLRFPATCVEYLIDAAGVKYDEEKHFEITPDGNIKWINQTRPGWNASLNRGTVYSIRYRYTPFFVCQKLLHEIRIAQITNPATFQRSVQRMPYQILVLRENVFQDTNNQNPPIGDDPRFQGAPSSGGMLGPTG